jgi:hypothetical protein
VTDVAALKAATDIVTVIGHYVALRKRGAEYVARCPFHEERTPSFTVSPVKQLYMCFGCGACGDVITFVQEIEGIDFTEAVARLNSGGKWRTMIKPEPAPQILERVTSDPPEGNELSVAKMRINALGLPSKVWTYRGERGQLKGYVARYEVEGKKEIRAWTWGVVQGVTKPGWRCGQWSKPRPLYGLDVLAARPDARVVVVEGEKACDAVRGLLTAMVGVTWPGGAPAWKHADWEPLRGRDVLLWPDADQPGRDAMRALGGILRDQKGLACRVRMLDVSDMDEGWDAADAAAAWSPDDFIRWAKGRVASL